MSKQEKEGKEIPEGKPEKAIELLRETSIIWKTEQEKYPVEQALKLAYQEGFHAAKNTSLKSLDEKEGINDLGEVFDISDVFEKYQKECYKGSKYEFHSFAEYLIRIGCKLLQPLQQGKNKTP